KTMLQGLLADRFDLGVHHATRELSVYALVVARRDGKLGPGLRPATLACESIGAKPVDSAAAQADYARCVPQMGLTRLRAPSLGRAGLGGAVMRILDRPVINKTSLSGTFDVELTWTPDPTMLPNGVPLPNSASAAPSIFTALEEQLGLRLVSDHAPVD